MASTAAPGWCASTLPSGSDITRSCEQFDWIRTKQPKFLPMHVQPLCPTCDTLATSRSQPHLGQHQSVMSSNALARTRVEDPCTDCMLH
jgi:hypothetical protein